MKINSDILKLPTPAVVVDLDVMEQNIRKMVEEARKHGLNHRPHVKTHRSSYLAHLQVEAGCKGITAAKIGEAEVMADSGIKDIFIAYPIIGGDKMKRLLALSEKALVSTIVNSYAGAKELSDHFFAAGKTIDVLIEIDGGLNRGGVKPGHPALAFANEIKGLQGIHINGLMYYGGLIYNAHNVEEIASYTADERENLLKTAGLLREAGFDMKVLSAGSSFSGKLPGILEGITEIRCGHYLFNDCGQLDVGLAAPEDCALFVETTVVAKPDGHVVICDVGTKSLTSDTCHHRPGYGYIVDYPEIEIYALNEEHAFLRAEGDNPLQVGDKILVIPNHACVVPNLALQVYGFREGKFDRMIPIDARNQSV